MFGIILNSYLSSMAGHKFHDNFVILFVLVDALRPWSTAVVMSGPSLILSTLFLGNLPEAGNQYLVDILLPLTDNCSFESAEKEEWP